MLLVVVACDENVHADAKDGQERLQVVTTIYPLEYFVQRIGGNAVAVTNMLPRGAEPHGFEPTAGTLRQLAAADVVIANGLGLDAWLEEATQVVGGADRVMVRASDGTEAGEVTGNDGTSETTDSDELLDPHAWLDPVQAMVLVRNIRDALATADSEHSRTYEDNAETLLQELKALHERYVDGLADCRRYTFVTAHAAFGHLAKRYSLEQLTIFAFSSEAVPNPSSLAKVVDTVRALGLTHVMVESMTGRSLTETLAREVGLEVLTLDPLTSLSDDKDTVVTAYPSLMEENLQALRIALACE